MVNIDGEKMSKSLGNVVWAKDLIEKIGANPMRWMMLSTHYRAPLNISDESVENAQKECAKVLNTLKQAYIRLARGDVAIIGDVAADVDAAFMTAMQDDLNTPNAFAAVFEATKRLNASLRQREFLAAEVISYVLALEKMLDILGIRYERVSLNAEDRRMFADWEQAKQAKDYDTADAYRAQLAQRGLL